MTSIDRNSITIRALQGFAETAGTEGFLFPVLPLLQGIASGLGSSRVGSRWITRHRVLCVRYASRDSHRLATTGRFHAFRHRLCR
jgi:hypothetical protein